MECTRCHKRKPKNQFSYKNKQEKIYFQYCDDCRAKTSELQKRYKETAKEMYELKKEDNIMECECGKKYIALRAFHIERHVNSKWHQAYIAGK